MDNKENRDRYLWHDIRAEGEKKEKNQDRVYYRHNRPFESMGEQNVLDQSLAYDESIDESRDFIDRLNFLDIVENEDLFSALKKLKKIDIDIIVLRYRNGFSFKDIAVRLNMAYDTVKKRHIRVLAKLREYMDK
jgi:DNA-directed RNA polymerase specialized sigma24 family protein